MPKQKHHPHSPLLLLRLPLLLRLLLLLLLLPSLCVGSCGARAYPVGGDERTRFGEKLGRNQPKKSHAASEGRMKALR